MKILILGGTGAIGTHLSKLLSKEGCCVTVTSRKKKNARNLIEYRKGNAQDRKFLQALLNEKWDVIVDFMNYTTKKFLGRVELLLASTTHYIFLSSSRVYGESNKLINEESPRLLDSLEDYEYLNTDEYGLAKARQEDLLRLSGKRNYTIIRPYITYSKNRLQLGNLEKENWLYRALMGKDIVFSKDILERKTTLTYGLNVSEAIINIIKKTKPSGEIYNISNMYSTSWKFILDIYLKELRRELGISPRVIHQNMDDYLMWNGKYQILYDRLFDREFDTSKIDKLIDTGKFLRPSIGLKACLNDFLSKPEFLDIDWRSEALKDRTTNEKTSIKRIYGGKNKVIYLLFRYAIRGDSKIYNILRSIKNYTRKNETVLHRRKERANSNCIT